MKAPRLVLIKWLDSHNSLHWTTEEPDIEALTCYTVGWLVHDGKDAKTVASSLTNEDPPQRCGHMTIPTRAVLFIANLRPPKGRVKLGVQPR